MNILLSCAGGFSSSLVVSKMRAAAKQRGLDAKIWAVNSADVRDEILGADILMIAPQIQYQAENMREICEERGIPFCQISQVHYGRCMGDEILSQALEALEKK